MSEREYFSVIKIEKDRIILQVPGGLIFCGARLFSPRVRENDLVFSENGIFVPDPERTLRLKAENRRRLEKIMGDRL